MKKRILFAPNQAGLAHIIRSLAVAEEINQNFEIYFVLDKRKAKIVSLPKSIKKIFVDEKMSDNKEGVIDALANTLNKKFFKEYVETYKNIIHHIKPNLIVSDANMYVWFAALVSNIPYLVVTNSIIFPSRAGVIGIKPQGLFQRLFGLTVSIVGNLWIISFYKVNLYQLRQNFKVSTPSFKRFLKEKVFIIPEFENYNNLRKITPNFNFVGPIINQSFEGRYKQWEEKIKQRIGNKKTIYLTFGGTGFAQDLFENLIKNLLKLGFFVIASTGTSIIKEEIKIKNENLILEKFISGMSASYLADVIVSHGSYGTITQAILSGKPIVCIPFNIDQVFHSERAELLGIGFSTFKWSLRNWIGDSKSIHYDAENANVDLITNKVKELIDNFKYSSAVKKIQHNVNLENGAKKSARIIENYLV